MKIFIDHFPEHSDFAERLAARIMTRNPSVNIITYSEDSKKIKFTSREVEDAHIITRIKESDIFIPIITASYLSGNTVELNDVFDDTTNNPDKFVFPVIWSVSNWSSKNWIVRSKIFPEGGQPLSNLSEENKEKEIDNLLNTIDNIIHSLSNENEKIDKNTLETSENIIFISHDHEDADFAELLKLQLEKHNLYCWIDSERLKIGQDWRVEIDEGIINSIAVIVIMSPEAKKSEYVTYEWAFAWGKEKRIFPLMLKQTALHPRLESLQYLDFTNRATRPWDKLIKSIKELI
ncbi:MAG: toll/interleukin-1 receptor domain-containing protein [Ferruginibacter sp.]